MISISVRMTGHIRSAISRWWASRDGVQIRGDGLPQLMQWFPEKPFDWIAEHSLDFWLTSEDLPLPENRIYYDGGRVVLDLTVTNMEGHMRLRQKLRDLCNKLDNPPASVRPLALSRPEHSNRRHGASGRHAAVRYRSRAIRVWTSIARRTKSTIST